MPNQIKNTAVNAMETQTAEVLYQRLGDRWYAFSIIDDDVFVGSITSDQLADQEKNAEAGDTAPSPKLAVNS